MCSLGHESMMKRRGFLKSASIVSAAAAIPSWFEIAAQTGTPEGNKLLHFASPFMDLQLSSTGPEIIEPRPLGATASARALRFPKKSIRKN